MKKSKKLLSIFLAVLMVFTSLSVLASAHADSWANKDTNRIYNANDKGMSTLLTDEERVAYILDIVDGFLKSAAIYQDVTVAKIDLRSLDAALATIKSYGSSSLLSTANTFYKIGLIKDLDFSALRDKNQAYSRASGDAEILSALLRFLDANARTLGDALQNGLDLGAIADLGEMKYIPKFLKKTIHDAGVRRITNGIGNDPEYPDEPKWDDLTAEQQNGITIDSIVQDLIMGIVSEPRNTTYATDPSDNDIITNPTAYSATAEMIHREADTGYYYIYGMKTDSGNWSFSVSGTEEQKQYITHWNTESALVQDFDASLIDFKSTDLYTLIGEIVPVIYNAYGADGLNGQLRATIMQWCGAYNGPIEDADEKAAVKSAFQAYLAMDDVSFAGELAKDGIFGTRNFLYFPLNGNTYYCVEWEGSYELYKVDTTNKTVFYDYINWEYQIGDWDTLWTAATGAAYNAASDNILGAVNNIIAYILGEAVPTYTGWTKDTGDQKNKNIETNVSDLIKYVISIDPEKIFGTGTDLPDDFASFGIEQIGVTIAKIVIDDLMPSLILPDSVSSLEEVIVYAVREFIAEILPECDFDPQILAATAKTGAAKEDAFLDVALRMGTSIAVYYVREALGYNVAPSVDATWEANLDGILEFVLDSWVPGLTRVMQGQNATVFNGNNPLDKLSIIFNALLPSALSFIGGCEGTVGDGDNAACTVDLKNVYNVIRGLLNGEIEPLASKLYRNDGFGTNSVFDALIILVEDLIGGFGPNYSTDYEGLKNTISAAFATENPLEELVMRKMSDLVAYLIWTLTDTNSFTAGTSYKMAEVWPQDLLRIVLQIMGSMDEMSYKGTTLVTDATNYFGNATASVVPTITFSVEGIASAFYSGGYRTGELKVDAAYTAALKKVEIANLTSGVVAATTGDISTPLTMNQAVTAPTLSFSAPSAATAYTVTAYFQVFAADGTSLSGDDMLTISKSIVASSQKPGDDITPFTILSDSNSNFMVQNQYIDENTPFGQAAVAQYTLNNTQSGSTRRKAYIWEYGTVSKDATTGAVSLTGSGNAAGLMYWVKTTDGVAGSKTYINNQTSAELPFYWYAKSSNEVLGSTFIDGGASLSDQLWLVDDTIGRDTVTEDFVQFALHLDSDQTGKNGHGLIIKTRNWIGQEIPYGFSFASQPQIVVYNSYGLAKLINDCLSSGRTAVSYTAESWTAYSNALSAAVAEWNIPRYANSFYSSHTDGDGYSKFQICAEDLEAAIAGLKSSNESASSGDSYTEDQIAALNTLKTQLDAQSDKDYDNKDFYAYRWWLYYNKYAELNSFYWSTQAPEAPVNKLAGVSDSDVDAAIAALPANLQALAAALKVAPTDEAMAAYAESLAHFNENLPKLDVSDLKVQQSRLSTYDSRLLADQSYKTYLNSAITQVESLAGAESAYTAQSYAAYAKALAEAKDVQGDAAAKPSVIHEARYKVLVAYNRLVGADVAADYTQLNDLAAQAEAILANQDLYTATDAFKAANSGLTDAEAKTQALANILATLGKKVTVGESEYVIGGGGAAVNYLDDEGFYYAVDQYRIDSVASALASAMANVVCTYVAESNNTDVNITVDNGEYVITGVTPGSIASAADIAGKVVASNTADTTLTFTANDKQGYGTGAKGVLTLNASGSVIATYVVVVYGDVNGDGVIDAFDTSVMDLAVTGGVNLSGAYRLAGGLTRGSVDAESYAAVKDAVVGLVEIAQK